MLHHKTIHNFESNFNKNDKYKLMSSIINNTELDEISENKKITNKHKNYFNHQLEELPISDQSASGTCWIYAHLNFIKRKIKERYNTRYYELSVNYLLFFDKLEKCNTILEILYQKPDNLSDYERYDLSFLLNSDGGNWCTFKSLILKYGIVPQSIYTNNPNINKTSRLNSLLNTIIQDAAEYINNKAMTRNEFYVFKHNVLQKCHRVLRILCGEPPKEFYIGDELYTPKSFYNRIVKRYLIWKNLFQ